MTIAVSVSQGLAAWGRPNSSRPFEERVSGEFRYFGSPWSMMRPPKGDDHVAAWGMIGTSGGRGSGRSVDRRRCDDQPALIEFWSALWSGNYLQVLPAVRRVAEAEAGGHSPVNPRFGNIRWRAARP